MIIRTILICILLIPGLPVEAQTHQNGDIRISGMMREVMWQGKIELTILLDTIQPQDGLYGIGPLGGLQGEILVLNGEKFVSRVISEEEMTLKAENGVGAPFFVYTHVDEWKKVNIPNVVSDLDALNSYLEEISRSVDQPFIFQVKAHVTAAMIHVQNLPTGTKVSSPEEAHQGQFDYALSDADVVIIGFFSTEHQGIFTHHDSYTHMHLITENRILMGHLDGAEFESGSMELLLSATAN